MLRAHQADHRVQQCLAAGEAKLAVHLVLSDGGEAAEVVTGILDSAPVTALSSRAEQKKSVL